MENFNNMMGNSLSLSCFFEELSIEKATKLIEETFCMMKKKHNRKTRKKKRKKKRRMVP